MQVLCYVAILEAEKGGRMLTITFGIRFLVTATFSTITLPILAYGEAYGSLSWVKFRGLQYQHLVIIHLKAPIF